MATYLLRRWLSVDTSRYGVRVFVDDGRSRYRRGIHVTRVRRVVVVVRLIIVSQLVVTIAAVEVTTVGELLLMVRLLQVMVVKATAVVTVGRGLQRGRCGRWAITVVRDVLVRSGLVVHE